MGVIGTIIFVFGVFLSLKTFLFKEGYRGVSRFLAAFLFFCAVLFYACFQYYIQNSRATLLFLVYGIHHVYFLIGPLAFFYVRSILRDNAALSSWDFLHFGLFIISFTGNIPCMLLSPEEKKALVQILHSFDWDRFSGMKVNAFLPVKHMEFLRILSILAYNVTLWVLILKHPMPSGSNDRQSRHLALIKMWLITFAVIFSIMVIQRVLIGGLLIVSTDQNTLTGLSVFTFFSIALIYILLNLIIFIFPKLSYGLLTIPPGLSTKEENYVETADAVEATLPEQRAVGYSWHKSYFQDEYLRHIEHCLAKWSSEENYLYNVSIVSLSASIGIPVHHLSYYFNHVLGVKYADWRNGLRVDCAKRLLDQGLSGTYNMEGIASKCGFSSRATFFRVFREVVGISPMEYIKRRNDIRDEGR